MLKFNKSWFVHWHHRMACVRSSLFLVILLDLLSSSKQHDAWLKQVLHSYFVAKTFDWIGVKQFEKKLSGLFGCSVVFIGNLWLWPTELGCSVQGLRHSSIICGTSCWLLDSYSYYSSRCRQSHIQVYWNWTSCCHLSCEPWLVLCWLLTCLQQRKEVGHLELIFFGLLVYAALT